jgi:serine/threonine-protein phosphatase 5
LDHYSEAIFCNVPPKKKAIYYCNRAQVSIKTENYALALFDATDATKNDPTFFKAYYRLGSANLALNKFDLAIQNFKQVCKMQPTNKDAR